MQLIRQKKDFEKLTRSLEETLQGKKEGFKIAVGNYEYPGEDKEHALESAILESAEYKALEAKASSLGKKVELDVRESEETSLQPMEGENPHAFQERATKSEGSTAGVDVTLRFY